MPPRVVIAGGGTGGHVFPALALAHALRQRHPDCALLHVGSEGGLEETLVPRANIPLELLRVGKLKGSALSVRLRTLAGLPGAVGRASSLLRAFDPEVVVGVGGFASAPVVTAATLMRRPTLLLEQNSVPGVTNRTLAHLADRVVTAFSCSAEYLPPGKVLALGNPVRPELLPALLHRATHPPRAEGAPPCLAVLGGSQGARAVNELTCGAAPELFERVPRLHLIHQSGAADFEEVKRRHAEAGLEVEVHAFIERMDQVYSRADLVLGRAGATTIAELCVAGVGAYFVPYPHAADEHQLVNAREMVQAGGAVMVEQQDLTASRLADDLATLLCDTPRLYSMGLCMRDLGRPHAAEDVARLVLQMASE